MPKTLKPKKYFVLFLDFLGQKDAFKAVSEDDLGKEVDGNLAIVSDAVRRAIGGAKLLHEAIKCNSDSLFVQLKSRGINPFSQAPAKWFQFEMSRSNFGVQQFSDGTMIYFELNDDLVPVVMPTWMFALCRLFLRCVYEGALPRGGMTIGEGIETEEGCLYGPVVDRVEYIERVVAQYPRIVISDDLADYMVRHSVEEIVPNPTSMVEVDSDGSYILNYLSREFLECPIHGSKKDDCWRYVRYFHWVVRNELAKFRDSGDGKLFLRYRMWDAYSFNHEDELREIGILRKGDAESCERTVARRTGHYRIGKFLILYLKVQPEPFSRLGYGTDPDDALRLREICDEIRNLHERLKNNFPEMMQEQYSGKLPKEDIEKTILELHGAKCGVTQMSNYLMFYAQNVGSSAGYFLDVWLLQMKIILRAYAAQGIFVRGGIDYGIGWELDPNVLYGPVIGAVSKIETDVAIYPRIVISESIKKELEEVRASMVKMGRKAEDELLVFDYIQKDEDGREIFDYLNVDEEPVDRANFKREMALVQHGHEVTKKACQWALANYRRQGLSDSRMIWPILSLEIYFRRKFDEWTQASKESKAGGGEIGNALGKGMNVA